MSCTIAVIKHNSNTHHHQSRHLNIDDLLDQLFYNKQFLLFHLRAVKHQSEDPIVFLLGHSSHLNGKNLG